MMMGMIHHPCSFFLKSILPPLGKSCTGYQDDDSGRRVVRLDIQLGFLIINP